MGPPGVEWGDMGGADCWELNWGPGVLRCMEGGKTARQRGTGGWKRDKKNQNLQIWNSLRYFGFCSLNLQPVKSDVQRLLVHVTREYVQNHVCLCWFQCSNRRFSHQTQGKKLVTVRETKHTSTAVTSVLSHGRLGGMRTNIWSRTRNLRGQLRSWDRDKQSALMTSSGYKLVQGSGSWVQV